MLLPVTSGATAQLDSAEARSVPRVGYLVYRVERRLRARLDEELRLHGISTPEYTALSLLRERDGLSCAQLARWVLVTPQAMNLVISALERRKLVKRRPDPSHGRVRRASVTPKGIRVLDDCDHAMDGRSNGLPDRNRQPAVPGKTRGPRFRGNVGYDSSCHCPRGGWSTRRLRAPLRLQRPECRPATSAADA